MVDANELRIGNYYKPTDGIGEEYKEVTADDLKAWSLGAIYGKPISLTPEILEKCGFEVRNVNMFYKKGMVDSLIYHYNGFCVWEVNQKVIKYLHQLQNLFYCLCGEELPVVNLMAENKNPVNINL